MTALRISPATSITYDSLKAEFERVGRALASGTTTTEALAQTDTRLAAMGSAIKALRVAVRGDIAGAQRREREDRSRRTA